MSPKIEIDASEPPEIDVLVEQLPWAEVESYVRIAQRFLLVEVPYNPPALGTHCHHPGRSPSPCKR
jgi:hypothetical protein